MKDSSYGFERDVINNQKRIIRELSRIAAALERLAGTDGRVTLDNYISQPTDKKEEE